MQDAWKLTTGVCVVTLFVFSIHKKAKKSHFALKTLKLIGKWRFEGLHHFISSQSQKAMVFACVIFCFGAAEVNVAFISSTHYRKVPMAGESNVTWIFSDHYCRI